MNNEEKEIGQAVRERVEAEKEALADAKTEASLTSRFVYDCLMANELGDGTLFTALHRHKFIYDKAACQWFAWTGHFWKLDTLERAYRAVEEVAQMYLAEADKLGREISDAIIKEEIDRVKKLRGTQNDYYSRVKRLRSLKGAQNCLSWAHRVLDGLSIHSERFDRNPWLLACTNGVIELRTGRSRPGRPDDLITKASPHNWKDIDEPAPAWEAFLDAVFDGDKDLINYLQRLFGYGITGLSTEHILPVLHGEGRNGKSTLVETLRYVLGPLAQPIQSEMLLDQRVARSSSGASPDTMTLKGLRIAFASETDEGRRFSTSRAKWLSSGDTLTGRALYDKLETVFEPTHLLCLLTNHLPHAPGDDFAFWQRIHLVPFNMKFVDTPQNSYERPRDKELPEKLKAEAPGILAWLVRGCIEWQRQGLNPPIKVKAATESYRFGEDVLAEFLEACCYPLEKTEQADRSQFALLYEAFCDWYRDTRGPEPPKKKKFSQLMEKRFRKEKAGGYIWFYGVSIKPVTERG
ncbi:hypothetical protein BAC1_01590 [uncultured bacterium]|nr:hypothetical protein BAC1_01590 [uncultured bacterium]